MMAERDKYAMLVGRKELAARYHKYLNKQIKERRVLYVIINVDDGSTNAAAAAAEGAEGDTGLMEGLDNNKGGSSNRNIRVKIKSGQTAEFLAQNLITK
jgi:hypothetical protein